MAEIEKKPPDIVFLKAHFKQPPQATRSKVDQVFSLDRDARVWQRHAEGKKFAFGTFCDGIGVYDVSTDEGLQQLVARAAEHGSSNSHIPDGYDE